MGEEDYRKGVGIMMQTDGISHYDEWTPITIWFLVALAIILLVGFLNIIIC